MPSSPSFHCHNKAWRQHHAEIRAFLKNRAGSTDEADDLMQEVFLKALHQGKEFCAIENARAWLFQVARNLLIDRLRLTKDLVPLPDDLLAETSLETEPVDLLSQCLPRVLTELSAEDSEAIILCDIEGMTQKAYAERLGLPLATAKSRVQRARQCLRSQLAHACKLTFDDEGKVCCFVPRQPLESDKSQ